jgi:hypothetical protein
MSQSTKDISEKTTVSEPLVRPDLQKKSGARIMAENAASAARRWWMRTTQRGHLRESIKTLLIVSSLTILIWVWAETQQMLQQVPISGVELKLTTSDRERILSLHDSGNPVVTLKVTGPKTGVAKVTEELTRTVPNFKEIDLGRNLPVGTRTFSLLDRIKDLQLFKDNGVSVTDVSPSSVTVDIDSVATVYVDVLPPPQVADKLQTYGFEPAKVHVRGPSSLIDDRTPVYADLESAEALKTPGQKELPSVRLFTRLPDRAGIQIDPPAVRAILEVKGDETAKWDTMTVFVSGPQSLLDKYVVKFDDDKNFIRDVTFIGPKDIIEELKKPKPNTPQPTPVLMIDSSDERAGARRKRLIYVNLPKGVRPSNDTERIEVGYHLEPRQP